MKKDHWLLIGMYVGVNALCFYPYMAIALMVFIGLAGNGLMYFGILIGAAMLPSGILYVGTRRRKVDFFVRNQKANKKMFIVFEVLAVCFALLIV